METPGPRRLALAVLDKVGRGKFAAPTLDQTLLRHRLSSQEAGLLTDLVYGTLRRERWLRASLEPLLERPRGLPGKVFWVLLAGAYEKLFTHRPPYAVVSGWVNAARAEVPRFAGLVNAVLRRVELAPATEPVRLGLPDFLYEHWRRFFGDVSWAASLNEPAPLWLTVFPGGLELLKAQGVGFSPGPIPGSVRTGGTPLRKIEAFRRGLAQPQNPASLLAARLLGDVSGRKVLDLAGGAGIKAAWLASRGAHVVSYDADPARQRAGRRNLERLGLEVEFRTRDLRRPLDETAPFVLLDAPCLGTGTLRGHPELRRRLRPSDLAASSRLQGELLETAAAATESGGTLLYAVCSLTADEGEEQIIRFLEAHPEFTPATPPLPLAELRRGHGVYVEPRDGLDGFYYARLLKT